MGRCREGEMRCTAPPALPTGMGMNKAGQVHWSILRAVTSHRRCVLGSLAQPPSILAGPLHVLLHTHIHSRTCNRHTQGHTCIDIHTRVCHTHVDTGPEDSLLLSCRGSG